MINIPYDVEGQLPLSPFQSNRLKEWPGPEKITSEECWWHVKPVETLTFPISFDLTATDPLDLRNDLNAVAGSPFYMEGEQFRYKKGSSIKRRKERDISGKDIGIGQIKLGYREDHINYSESEDFVYILRDLRDAIKEAVTEMPGYNRSDPLKHVMEGWDVVSLEYGSVQGEGIQFGNLPGTEIETPGACRFKPDPMTLLQVPMMIKKLCDMGTVGLPIGAPGTTAMGYPFHNVTDVGKRLAVRTTVAPNILGSIEDWDKYYNSVQELMGLGHVWIGYTRFQPSKVFTPIIQNMGNSFTIVKWIKHAIRLREVYGGSIHQLCAEIRPYLYLSRIKSIRGAHSKGDDVYPWFMEAISKAKNRGEILVGTDISAHDKSYHEDYKKALFDGIAQVLPPTAQEWFKRVIPFYSGVVLRPGYGTPNISHTLHNALPSGALHTAVIGAFSGMGSHVITANEMRIPSIVGHKLLNQGDDESSVCTPEYLEHLNDVRKRLGFLSSEDEDGVFLRRCITPEMKRQNSIVRTICHEVWPERPYTSLEAPFFAASWLGRDNIIKTTMRDGFPAFWPAKLKTAKISKQFQLLVDTHNRLRPDDVQGDIQKLSSMAPAWLEALVANAEHSSMDSAILGVIPKNIINAAIKSNWMQDAMDKAKPLTPIDSANFISWARNLMLSGPVQGKGF